MDHESVKKFVTKQYRDEINDKDLDPQQDEIIEELHIHLQQNGVNDLDTLINEHGDEYGLELDEIRSFLDTLKRDDLVETKDEEEVTTELGAGVRQALKTRIQAEPSPETIITTDEEVSNEDREHLTEEIYLDSGKKAFVISKQQTFEGRISMELARTRERFHLTTVYEDGDGRTYFQHFGEGNPNKGFNKIDQHTHSFFKYKFQSNHKEYLVFSTEKLEPMRCRLHGTKVSISDYKTVGENRKLPTDQEIIFVHSYEPAIQPLTAEELDERRKSIDREWFMHNMLGNFRHPDWYEDMLAAVFLAKEDNGYPSHLLQQAAPGTGKSALLNSLLASMDESNEVFTGQSSTVKGLVPSFKESPPEEGYIMRCDRVAAIDEMFDLLSNTVRDGDSSQRDAFRPLLDLMTHATREYSSGNGSIVGKTDATLIAMGNDAYGLNSIYDALDNDKIDPAFLSRFLLYDQLESHIAFVDDRKKRMDDDEEKHLPERNDEFISVLDTMRMRKDVELDNELIAEIHDELTEIVPSVFIRAFKARYDHHLKNMVTGIAKLRFLTEDRDVLEVQPEDYEDARNILEMLISSWGSVELTLLSFRARLNALTHAQRQTFEVVNDDPGITGKKLYERMPEKAQKDASRILTKLRRDAELITVVEADEGTEKYYPYWTEEFKEAKAMEEE